MFPMSLSWLPYCSTYIAPLTYSSFAFFKHSVHANYQRKKEYFSSKGSLHFLSLKTREKFAKIK